MKAGWIDRNGKLHICLDWEHDKLATDLGFTSQQLDNMMWIRFSEANKRFDFDRNNFKAKPTSKQFSTCFDLAKECNMIDEFNNLTEWFND